MNNRVCFVNLKREGSGLYVAESNSLIGLFRCWLSENNIESMDYVDNNLPSLVDTADDILSIVDDHIMFWIEESNMDLTKALIKQIQELEPEMCLSLLSTTNVTSLGDELGIKAICSDFETQILSFLEYTDVVNTEMNDEHLSPYSKGIIHPNKSAKLGIPLGIKTATDCIERDIKAVIEDIRTISQSIGSEHEQLITIPIFGIPLNEFKEKEELLNSIEDTPNLRFEILVEMSGFVKTGHENVDWNIVVSNEKEVKDLIKLKNKVRIHHVISSQTDLLEENTIISLVDYAHKQGIKLIFNHLNNDWRSIDSDQVKKMFKYEKGGVIDTFTYGYIFSWAGDYVTVPLNGYTKHVRINAEILSEDILQKLSEFCSINSSICIQSGESHSEEKYKLSNMSEIYRYNHEVQNVKKMMDDSGSLPMTILLKDEQGDIQVDSVVRNLNLQLREISYKGFKELDKIPLDVFHNIKLEDAKDYELLLEDVETFRKNKNLAHSPLLYGKMQNSCRFMSRNHCSLTKIPRLTIANDGELYPCDDCSKSIGNINSNAYFDVMQNAYVCSENNFNEKNCGKCPAVVFCPKCSLLPDALEMDYCEIMRERSYITDFIIESIVLKQVMLSTPSFSKYKLEDIYLSNEYFQYYLDDVEDGNELPFFSKYVFMTIHKGEHTIWSPNTNKTFRISKEIALIAECLFKRMSPSTIQKFLQERLGLKAEEVEHICTVTYDYFNKFNLLYRAVN